MIGSRSVLIKVKLFGVTDLTLRCSLMKLADTLVKPDNQLFWPEHAFELRKPSITITVLW